MKKIIQNGRVIDPSQNLDGYFDVAIENGKIAALAKPGTLPTSGSKIINAKDQIVAPGFIDLHTHLREPGFEYKETIASGTRAAVAGGFTCVCCMANTNPVNDNASVTEFILQQARTTGVCRVHPIGAITKGLQGEELAPMAELKACGCVAVSDDGLTVQNAQMMRLALDYAKMLDLPVSTHSIDANLAKLGHMNESVYSTKMGVKGSPSVAEDVIIARDIMLSEITGAHLHVGHLSTQGGMRLVGEAKRLGLRVTCEVAPHHFTLTDADIKDYNTNFKMCPPLRSKKDVNALQEAMAQGLVDAIATDHAPHGVIDKAVEFDQAAFGIIGFETALPLSLRLVTEGCITLPKLIAMLTHRPAQIFRLHGGSLQVGMNADVTIFNPDLEWVLHPESIVSKSKNSPWLGSTLKGRVTHTLVAGEIKYQL